MDTTHKRHRLSEIPNWIIDFRQLILQLQQKKSLINITIMQKLVSQHTKATNYQLKNMSKWQQKLQTISKN